MLRGEGERKEGGGETKADECHQSFICTSTNNIILLKRQVEWNTVYISLISNKLMLP